MLSKKRRINKPGSAGMQKARCACEHLTNETEIVFARTLLVCCDTTALTLRPLRCERQHFVTQVFSTHLLVALTDKDARFSRIPSAVKLGALAIAYAHVNLSLAEKQIGMKCTFVPKTGDAGVGTACDSSSIDT